MKLRNSTFFFSRLPRSRLGGLAFAVLTCFLLVGMVASTCGGIRGGLSVDCFDRWFLPDSRALGAGYLVSWALSLGAIASITFRLWQLPLPLLFFTPFASLVFLEYFGFVGVDGGFGSGFRAGVQLWVVLSARYPARPRLLLP